MLNGKLFVGVDGGGTKCRARISDMDGTILGEGRGGPANTRLGLDVAFGSIVAATDIALASAGLELDRKKDLYAGLGLAGVSLQRERHLLALFGHPFKSMTIESDAYIACLGAHGGQNGGILILGTGSCGCAITDGVEQTVGGWGFEISDYGSGAFIGHQAVRRSLLAFEGVVPMGGLAIEVMDRLGNSPERAVPWAEKATPSLYGAFAPLVSHWAEDGDPMAVDIMRQAGYDTGLLLRALKGTGTERLVLAGGVAEAIRPWLSEEVKSWLVEPIGDALAGALLLAQMRCHGEECRGGLYA
ncbi:N-acetylglucosamine kinase [Pseudodesulfovibrio sp. JC047]|uniref:BadF/BadG/BcrA/BcrD ATPase family protein n=1 Tax=Pseudodesulfovibrio sp. JC047 TaxID=2683199 RepID=UPI0013D140BC|nr:BadF/BadG/BcrA/BcrD ATPase family protein [Pseudodesulfovibrio sp. JC047]NDV18691.1 N-acetylglucosamine kinase [Pseudodesulfovibrio sp. JC047]